MSRTIYIGGTEYLDVEISGDVNLDSQAVALSLDAGQTWLDAIWQGDAGYVRTASVLFGSNGGAPMPPVGKYNVTARVTDVPEIPLIPAGLVIFKNPR